MYLYKLNQAGFDFFSWSQPKTIAVQITAGGTPTLEKERFSLFATQPLTSLSANPSPPGQEWLAVRPTFDLVVGSVIDLMVGSVQCTCIDAGGVRLAYGAAGWSERTPRHMRMSLRPPRLRCSAVTQLDR